MTFENCLLYLPEFCSLVGKRKERNCENEFSAVGEKRTASRLSCLSGGSLLCCVGSQQTSSVQGESKYLSLHGVRSLQ